MIVSEEKRTLAKNIIKFIQEKLPPTCCTIAEIEKVLDVCKETLKYLSVTSPKSNTKWISCNDELPINDKPCLVTCREFNIFSGKYGEKEIQILSFSVKDHKWNTKADILVEAWCYLPELYESEI